MSLFDNIRNQQGTDYTSQEGTGGMQSKEQQELDISAETNLFNALLELKPKLREMGFYRSSS